MYAIEFEADVHNGIIKLPQKYRDITKKHVKIIAFVEQEKTAEIEAQKKSTLEDTTSFFEELKNRHFTVDNSVNIDTVMQSIND